MKTVDEIVEYLRRLRTEREGLREATYSSTVGYAMLDSQIKLLSDVILFATDLGSDADWGVVVDLTSDDVAESPDLVVNSFPPPPAEPTIGRMIDESRRGALVSVLMISPDGARFATTLSPGFVEMMPSEAGRFLLANYSAVLRRANPPTTDRGSNAAPQ